MGLLDTIARVFKMDSVAREARREHRLIHETRRTWLALGFTATNQDAGNLEIPNATRDEAVAWIARNLPRATIINIDTVHWTIAYRLS